jgi:hypothetical protein
MLLLGAQMHDSRGGMAQRRDADRPDFEHAQQHPFLCSFGRRIVESDGHQRYNGM